MQKYTPYFILVNSIFLGVFLLFISGGQHLYAQNSKDLKQQKENVEKQIIWVENKIKNTLKQQDSAFQRLDLLSENILLREKKISLLNAELKKVYTDLENQQEKKKILDQNQRKLQQAYKDFMVKAYKDLLQYDPLTFIFSADDFNQAIDRYKYTETHAEERKKSLLALKNNQEKLEENGN